MAFVSKNLILKWSSSLLFVTKTFPFAFTAPLYVTKIFPFAFSSYVTKGLTAVWDSLAYNYVTKKLKLIWARQTTNSGSIQNYAGVDIGVEGFWERMDFTSFSLRADIDSFCWSFSGTMTNPSQFELVKRKAYLRAVVNTEIYILRVDTIKRNRSFGSDICTIEARSQTSVLDSQPDYFTNYIWPNYTANQVFDRIAAMFGITIDTSAVLDWSIPLKNIISAGKTGIAFCQEIATAAGCFIYTAPAGGLKILPRNKIAPTVYSDYSADFSLTDNDDIVSVDAGFISTKRYNAVIVSDAEVIDNEAQYIILELDTMRNCSRLTFNASDAVIYLRVYTTLQNYELAVTSGTCERIVIPQVVIKNEDEYLAFIYNTQPTLSKPIYEITAVRWYGNNLGAITPVENTQSQVEAADATTESLGIARVSYNSVCDIWAVYPPNYVDKELKILVIGYEVSAREKFIG